VQKLQYTFPRIKDEATNRTFAYRRRAGETHHDVDYFNAGSVITGVTIAPLR
jgi:hypothetical protein